MDSRIHDLLRNYICPQLGGVRFIGIHGMRGIGKTTLARAIHDEICQDFDRTCFLSNVREKSEKHSLVSLQEKLLSRILMTKDENIDDEYAGAAMIERRLCKLKVLVVIDDVDHINQLNKLAGCRDWFGPGSRIIVTTPDIHLLRGHDGTDKIRAMVMDLPELEVAHWKPEAFSNLSQVSLLHIRNVDLPKGLTFLSNSLRLLDWSGYPLRSLPQNFEPDKLIELNLCRSNIEHLREGAKIL
ncbi:putative P-loop containing nucleoside triphosphate hydrolase, leucine-rich repeat domain, L [Rosa chinensis]|uniref:Putative P-loop containing nucleoside triphosphate hydrolase, leucine-rich repeat domain, L n=1 Tax=Rosa chinensis TaxID=74649 RepID=A0A2P6PKL0_ROSCH|nr:putative P-loop containing nucleoside triphosphate hydrolase, leucine-rich repeat domain, L [Rosa chinensis]